MVRAAVALLGAMLLEAHPLHTSFTELTRDGSGVVTISVRLFADDFWALLDAMPEGKSQGREAAAQRYVGPRLLLSSGSAPVKLEWCGSRTADNLVWVCLRSAVPIPLGKLRLRNTLMFDRFADQINIIRWTRGARTQTLVLSARMPEVQLE
jgi:uncharacterized protein DUF6702